MKRFVRRPGIGLLSALLLAPVLCLSAAPTLSAQSVPPMSATRIPQSDLIQPAQLAHELQGLPDHRPLVLQVGFRMLFKEAHIVGAEYAGPASSAQGQQALRNQVKSLSRDRFIVIYCGCCPWTHCPNVGAAWHLLHSMGFKYVRVLYIAHNFGTDWIAPGYPVQRSN